MEESLLPRSVTDHIREKLDRIPSKVCIVVGCALTIVYGAACAADPPRNSLVLPLDLAASSDRPAATLKKIITDPKTMYASFGFVSMPVLNMCCKAFFNFGIQSLCLVGKEVFHSSTAIQEKMKKVSLEDQFSVLSILFQVAGQISAVYSFYKLMLATKCWQGLLPLATYLFLVSQQNSSISIIVGVAYNYVLQLKLPLEGWQRTLARCLLATGLFIGTPIWIATVSAMCISMYGIIAAICMVIFFYYCLPSAWRFIGYEPIDESINLFKAETEEPLASLLLCLLFGTFSTTALWTLYGLWTDRLHSILLTCATFVELFLPVSIVLYVGNYKFGVRHNFNAMLIAFAVALTASYMVVMLVPTSILAWQPGVRFGEAAPKAFWGKNIKTYLAYTFITPAYHDVEMLQYMTGENNYEEVFRLWLLQLLAFFA